MRVLKHVVASVKMLHICAGFFYDMLKPDDRQGLQCTCGGGTLCEDPEELGAGWTG